MADPRLFHRRGPFSLAQLAAIAGAEAVDGPDDGMPSDVATLELARIARAFYPDEVPEAGDAGLAATALVEPGAHGDATATIGAPVPASPPGW
jgi:hypothetical protein